MLSMYTDKKSLVHLLDESVDVLLTVAKITTLNKVLELAGAESASRVGQLEWPEEIADLLEVGPDGVDLVDHVLNADNAVLAETLLNDGIISERDTLLVDLAITALVDELADRLEVGVAVSNERLGNAEHLDGGLSQTDKHAVVDLEETEELKRLALLRVDLVDTLDTDDKG